MEYTITHSIIESIIYFQVIHNKTNTYYESFIENTDIHRQIFENINNMELNFHICDTKLFLFFDYIGKSYDFEINKKDINTIKFKTLEAKYNALKDETTVQYKKLEDKYKKLEELIHLKNIYINHTFLKLEQQLKIYEEQTPIVFKVLQNRSENILDNGTGMQMEYFYQKSLLLIDSNPWRTSVINPCISSYNIDRLYMPYQHGAISIRNWRIIIPPRKIMKVWKTINLEPTYYTCGIYEILLKDIDMIWLGSEECKDDIPDNLIELARK
jgi:hypothetical protein